MTVDYAALADGIWYVCLGTINDSVAYGNIKYKQGKSFADVVLASDAADMVIGGKEEWVEAMAEFLKDIVE